MGAYVRARAHVSLPHHTDTGGRSELQCPQNMAEIVAEIAESAFRPTKNPMSVTGEEQMDREDTNAEVVPDLFEIPRRYFTTGEPNYRPARLLRAGTAAVLVLATLQTFNAVHVLSTGMTVEEALGEQPDREAIGTGVATLELLEDLSKMIGMLCMVPLSFDLCSAIHPMDGYLQQLGAGTQKASRQAVQMLNFWRRCAYFALVFIGGFGIMIGPMWGWFIYMNWFGGGTHDRDMDGQLETFTNAQAIMNIIFFVSMNIMVWGIWPGCLFWLLSLKVAAVLAEDSVIEVVKDVTLESVGSDETFYPKVFEPCMNLARKQIPRLSAGWGRGAAFACLIAWCSTLAKFCRFLSKLHDPFYIAEEGQLAPFLRHFVPAVLYAIGPIVVIMDLAAVSTMCDKLMDRINLVSTECTSVEHLNKVYKRTNPMLTCLKELNTGQGLGFCVFTVVVDKKTLNKLVLAVLSTFATLVPIILALQPQPPEVIDNDKQDTMETQCMFTPQQLAGLRTMVMAVVGPHANNTTCSWNMTINEILLMDT